MNCLKLTLALAASLAVIGGVGAMVLQDGIEEIMEKGFKKGGLKQQIDTELRKDKPDWESVAKKTSELAKLCTALCKEKQPQGEADSWKKLTEALTSNVKSLNESASKKDQERAKTVMTKINGSCKECHDIHRP